jgi:hypothetical protein
VVTLEQDRTAPVPRAHRQSSTAVSASIFETRGSTIVMATYRRSTFRRPGVDRVHHLTSIRPQTREGDAVLDPSVRGVPPQIGRAALGAADVPLRRKAAADLPASDLGSTEIERRQEPEHRPAATAVLRSPAPSGRASLVDFGILGLPEFGLEWHAAETRRLL